MIVRCNFKTIATCKINYGGGRVSKKRLKLAAATVRAKICSVIQKNRGTSFQNTLYAFLVISCLPSL